jgi:hypothetical protein
MSKLPDEVLKMMKAMQQPAQEIALPEGGKYTLPKVVRISSVNKISDADIVVDIELVGMRFVQIRLNQALLFQLISIAQLQKDIANKTSKH